MCDPRIRDAASSTRLAVQRKIARLSQAELAESSDVSLRSIQMYEQKNKNVNRVSSEALLRLPRTLLLDGGPHGAVMHIESVHGSQLYGTRLADMGP